MSKWKDKDFWRGVAGEVVQGKTADWPNTRFPTGGRLNSKSSQVIREMCPNGMDPWLIVVSPQTTQFGGVLAAWDDRLAIVKAGLLTAAASGSFGGHQAATFHFTDITGIEFNAGLTDGVLEIMTAGGDRNKTAWRAGGLLGYSGDNPAKSNNALPLDKSAYEQARADIEELRHKIAAAKKPQVVVSMTAPEAAPDIADQIRKLADLHAAGVLTDDEFTAKKAELLSRM